MLRLICSFVICSTIVIGQQLDDAAGQGFVLPAANSDAASSMLTTAIDKTFAYGRGEFSTTEIQDSSMVRNVGMGHVAEELYVDGGWARDLLWADSNSRDYIKTNGRMLTKVDGDWRLRRNRLAGGFAAPFTLDPEFFLTALRQLPAAAMDVMHVEAGELRGKQMALLTIKLTDTNAMEFADSGAIPAVGGEFGQVVLVGGFGGIELPRPDIATYVVFYVDVENSDLARLVIKSVSTDDSMVQIQLQLVGGGAAADIEEVEAGEKQGSDAGVDAALQMSWKNGLPTSKPSKNESVMTLRADFRKLGLATSPKLDDRSKALLLLR